MSSTKFPRARRRIVAVGTVAVTAMALMAHLAYTSTAETAPMATVPPNFGLPTDYQPTPERYGIAYQMGQVIPLSDGTMIHAEVRYPTDPATGQRAAGPFPVILNFTPYGAVGADQLNYTGLDNPINRQFLGQYSAGLLDILFRLFNAKNPGTETVVEPTAGLKYTMAPVTSPTMLAGPSSLILYASSTSTDAAFQVWLDDVAPDGSAVNITGGSQLASQRTLDSGKTWRTSDGVVYGPEHTVTKDHEQLLVPGQVTRMEIKIRPAFHRLEPGHALRLRITTGTFPETMPIPTDLPRLLGSSQQIMRTTVYPSALAVPLIKDYR